MRIHWVVCALVALVAALAGTAAAQFILSARLEQLDSAHAETKNSLINAKRHNQELEAQVEQLNDARDQAEYDLLMAREAAREAEDVLAFDEEDAGTADETSTELATGTTDQESEGPRERGPRGDWNNPERMAEIRERMDERIIERWERTEDPGQKERIALFAEHQQYMMDLMQNMMQAEDDASRDAVRAQMAEARENFGVVVQGEQSKVIASVGAKYGVDAAQQQSFERAVRSMLRDPAFTSGGGMTPMGGFGGGRRGGDRGRRGDGTRDNNR